MAVGPIWREAREPQAVQAITVNRKVAMVLGGIAAAAALLVFFAGFITAVGLFGGSAGSSNATTSASLAHVAIPKAPGLAVLPAKPADAPHAVPPGDPMTRSVAPPPVADTAPAVEPAPAAPARATLPGAVPPRAALPPQPARPAPAARPAGGTTAPAQQQAAAPAPARPAAPSASPAPPTRLVPPTTSGAAPSPASPPASAQKGAGAAGGFAVQVGAFLTGSHAERLSEDLKKRGHDARVVVETDTSGRPWHIVRVGRFTDRYTALSAANRLKSAEGVPTMVVTELPGGPALR